MKNTRKIIEIDEQLCNGCGECVPDCAEGSLKIINGKAKLVADKLCDGLGACLGACPTGALKIIEREADEFDEEAVEVYLAKEKELEKRKKIASESTMDCGCASSHIQSFPQAPTAPAPTPCQSANKPSALKTTDSADEASVLGHWPIQIRLVPPTAPFLKGTDLLVAADCTAIAARNFQQRYLEGNSVMMGCPKFDDAENYIQKFAEIVDQSGIKSITILIMEVPCCSAMNVIIKKALERASNNVPVTQITITLQGEEKERISW